MTGPYLYKARCREIPLNEDHNLILLDLYDCTDCTKSSNKNFPLKIFYIRTAVIIHSTVARRGNYFSLIKYFHRISILIIISFRMKMHTVIRWTHGVINGELCVSKSVDAFSS